MLDSYRVWAVEAVSKPREKYAYWRSVGSIDEDSWQVAASDGWNLTGRLWRIRISLPELAQTKMRKGLYDSVPASFGSRDSLNHEIHIGGGGDFHFRCMRCGHYLRAACTYRPRTYHQFGQRDGRNVTTSMISVTHARKLATIARGEIT